MIYSSGNSQINQNGGVVENHLLETKGVHSNIFTEEKMIKNTMHPHYQVGHYQGRVQNPIQIQKMNSDPNLQRYDPFQPNK